MYDTSWDTEDNVQAHEGFPSEIDAIAPVDDFLTSSPRLVETYFQE